MMQYYEWTVHYLDGRQETIIIPASSNKESAEILSETIKEYLETVNYVEHHAPEQA